MAGQTTRLTFTGKCEPTDVHIGIESGVKSEHFNESPSSSEEPGVSNVAISDWEDNLGLAGKVKSCAESAEGSSASRGHDEDTITDLSSIDESPVQPILQSFPVSVIAGKPRRFTPHWYSKYGAWLEYSAEKDAIFCKMCRHFGNNLIADKFTRGFRNWKRTHQACSKHELSKAHNTALCKYMNYKESQQASRAALLNQSENHHLHHHHTRSPGLIQTNRDHIKVILDVVMFCVRQQTVPCKHKENGLGNFNELFQLLCKYDPRIKSQYDAIHKNKNSALTGQSQDIQNDLMDAAASLLLRQIKQELHNTKNTYYAVLADECSDQSKRQLVAVSLRYLCGGSIRERVVGFVDTGDASAEGIALKMLRLLEPFELDPGLCVGFGFDGASVMSGVERILGRTFTRALYVHCCSHSLKSVLCDTSKSCADFKTFSEAIHALCLFVRDGSHRQARFLEIQKEMHPDQPFLEPLCDAQTQPSSVADVFHLFDVVLEMLMEFAESGGQAGLEAQSLLQQVQTKKFTFLLVASCTLLEVSEDASKSLQSDTTGQSLIQCIDSIESLKQSLSSLRHSGFEQILTVSNELTEKNEIENWDVSVSRKRKLQSRHDSDVFASLGKSSRVRCAEDLRTLWNQILDSQINELDSRFHRDFYCLIKAAAALCTSKESNLVENIHPVSRSYGVEISNAELLAFSQILQQQISSSSSGPHISLIQVFDTCSEENFPNLHLLIRILLTHPITTCTDERMCSSVNKIKTASRSTMLTAQLNPLSLLSFEKDLTDSLDYDEIIDIFYFIKFIKPFISQGGKVESVKQPLLAWKPMIPV